MYFEEAKEITLLNCCLPVRDRRHLAPPQGLLAIATVLKKAGINSTLMNAAELISPDEFGSNALAEVICGQTTSVVGLSVWDSVLPFVVSAIFLAKQSRSDLFVVLGGPAASTVGAQIIAEFPWIDCIVTGEGETGLPPVLSFLSGELQSPDKLPSGVFIRWQGKVVAGEGTRSRLKGEQIVTPDYTLFNFDDYGRFEVSTSRGCIHNCRFCSVNSAWGKGISIRPIASVLREIDQLHKTVNNDLIHVLDDSFLSSPNRVKSFCKGLRKLGSHLRFSCYARIDELNPTIIDILETSGCAGLYMGLESPRIKDSSISVYQSLKLISELSLKFNILTSLIWGDPEETKVDFEETLDCSAKLLNISDNVVVNLYQLAPLSGTFYAKYHRDQNYDPACISEFVYPGYLPPLTQDKQAEDLIKKYPNLFPAFYRVKTPYFDWKKHRVEEFLKNPLADYQPDRVFQGPAEL